MDTGCNSKRGAEMKIYFVRHGQSEQNFLGEVRGAEEWQGSAGGLTAKGKAQALAAAEKLRTKSIEILIASSHDRGQETAEIIAKKLGAPITTSSLFVERRNPTEIWYTFEDDPGVKATVDLLKKNFHNNDWRHSDEENASDLLRRARQALDYLESLPYETIAVVSHGAFLRALFSLMLPPHYTRWVDFAALQNFALENGQIVEWSYGNKKWKLHGMLRFKIKNFLHRLLH